MDLSTLDTGVKAEAGAVLELLHPVQNTPIGIKITLAGMDSDIYRTTVNKMANKRIKRLTPGRGLPTLTAEEQDENALTILAACTLAWEGVVVDGQDLPYSQENAKDLYRRFPWIKEQVDGFIGDRNNFLAN